MMPKTSLIIASLLAALPIAAYAQTPSTYVATAGAGDLFEQTSSKLVLRTTKDAKAAALKAGVKAAPPQMSADQKSKIAALTDASGKGRDQLYWQQQKAAHKEALALHQGYASTGSAAPLKAAAAQIVPVVQHHLQMLDSGGTHDSAKHKD
jgi:putative membrane protein